jgi:hypothetical protein
VSINFVTWGLPVHPQRVADDAALTHVDVREQCREQLRRVRPSPESQAAIRPVSFGSISCAKNLRYQNGTFDLQMEVAR